ncbi:hypothetical protein KPH14_009719 [Odynerus spinipes]|uniref:Uncharacterized protein n=1 Tax=Odynerus spinipes TaxID=1348599 RepID=A0AAD9RR65_9HYME|nr:hypothetical protein KPH14_009719 [Odynerus spinipes]
MQGRTSLLVFLVVTISIVEIQSAPHSKLYDTSYQYPQTIQVHPEYVQIAAYQNAHAPYYVYNLLQVHTDLATGAPTILPDKQTMTLTHLPPYGYYYGTPVYDFRFPINPVYPVFSPSYPGFAPGAGSPPISTQRPFDVDNSDDGIEKLDTKVDPETGMRKPEATGGSFDDDDTISVEAI